MSDEDKKTIAIKTEQWYKLNMRDENGQVRQSLPSGLVYEMSRKWGDIIASISSNRWSTLEDMVQAVWEREKKQYLKSITRTRRQIEEAISELTEAGIIIRK
jgi:hypothetical protein